MEVIKSKGSDFLGLERVCYGRNDTPENDREYTIIGIVNCPVGTVSEWKSFAKDKGFHGIRVFQKDGSVDFVFLDEGAD